MLALKYGEKRMSDLLTIFNLIGAWLNQPLQVVGGFSVSLAQVCAYCVIGGVLWTVIIWIVKR